MPLTQLLPTLGILSLRRDDNSGHDPLQPSDIGIRPNGTAYFEGPCLATFIRRNTGHSSKSAATTQNSSEKGLVTIGQ